ncbi:hypothetical protein AB0K00_09220 [Dactylosporangium sp. NPDC049525]|uniref:hypothetical protein n=1 Tax=Dactylosporangium sp. NPDC049525 TaxID=3154730 RepID=UPI003418D48F
MTGLRDLLIEAAEDARDYDVTDRAVRVVRRQRMTARLVPVAAALLVVAGLLAVGVPFGGGGDQDPLPAAAGLPARLIPQASPPTLPEDRGVGRAALAYLRGDSDGDENSWVLVTADGSQYRVNGLRVDGMSPDGRWLLVLRSDGTKVLRDLAGTARHEFAGGDPSSGARWSPDSRRLVVQIEHRTAAPSSVVTYLVDLATGARATVPLDPTSPDRVCAVRNSGVLVLCPSPESSFSGLRLADGTTGQVIRDIPSANLGLRPTEAEFGTPVLGPDDHTLFISTGAMITPGSTAAAAAGGQQRFLVGFDIDTGRLTERYPLPDQIPGAQRSATNGGVEYGQPDARYLLGIHADGPLLLHIAPSRSDPFTAGAVSIELVARDTGALRTVTLASRPITLICYPG